MPEDAIALRTTYEVPLIWLDRTHGRERLAGVPAEATFRLRRVDPGDMVAIGGNPLQIARFEGRLWRRVAFLKPDSLERMRDMMSNDGMAACSWFALNLPAKLTTRPALDAFEDGGLPGRIAAGAVERLDSQARERARLAVERDLLWDGTALRFANVHSLGMPAELASLPEPALDCVGTRALRLLEYISDFAARDPEVGGLAAEVRRIAVRGLVHAIPLDGMEPAVRKVGRLAEIASRRAPGRSAKGFASLLLDLTRSTALPALASTPIPEDEDSLGVLAP